MTTPTKLPAPGFTLEDCKEPRRSVTVADGKYIFISPKDDWRVFVLRYGEPWLTIEAGHNAIAALMDAVPEKSTVEEDVWDPTPRMLRVGGSKTAFRCETHYPLGPCNGNVFRSAVGNPNRFKCNSCGATYEGEAASDPKAGLS